jgi:CRP-like cAMP-binding protein
MATENSPLVGAAMANPIEILQQYGKECRLAPGGVLCWQGAVSDGIYYLKSGRLGVYKEEHDAPYPLSEVRPGDLVGELGSATGWPRTATVRAEEVSFVIHVSEADFRALDESPGPAVEVVCKVGELLTGADAASPDS